MNTSLRARALGLFLALGLLPLTVTARTVAILSDLKGSATLAGAPAKLMGELPANSTLEVAAEGVASVMFLVSGKEFTLKGPGKFQIGSDAIKALSGSAPTARQTPWKVSEDVMVKVSQTAPASIRMRSLGVKLEVVMPATGKVASLQPVFQWSGATPEMQVEFELAQADGVKVISAKTQGERFTLPATTLLKAGTQYRWTVRPTSGATEIPQGEFETLSAKQIDRLNRLKPRDASPTSDWAMYALTLHDVGAYQEAKLVWQRLAKVRPEFAEFAR